MKAVKTTLSGLWLFEVSPSEDQRGLFARTFCEKTFKELGLQIHFPQCSTSFNARTGTVRGLHWQASPHDEIKVIRCTRGKVFDVIVDLRSDSKTYLKWESFELSADNRRSLYVPAGCAHGFQSLEDKSEVYYMISAEFHPESARGLRWDDPKISLRWPLPVAVISERDQQWPHLK